MPTPVAVKLDTDVHSRVKALAEARDRSPHWMMREAIAQYVEREEKREAFRQGRYPRLGRLSGDRAARDTCRGGCLAGPARRW